MSAKGWDRLDKYNVKGTFNGANTKVPNQMIC